MTQKTTPFADAIVIEGTKTEEINWVEVNSIDQATHLLSLEWEENPPTKCEIESFTMKINKSGEKVLDSINIKSDLGYIYSYDAEETSGFKDYKFYKKEVIVKESPKKIQIEVDEETAYMIWSLVGNCNTVGQENTLTLFNSLEKVLSEEDGIASDYGYDFRNSGSSSSLNLMFVRTEKIL
jgi:uncharacterized protein YktA (UPF0223 family)